MFWHRRSKPVSLAAVLLMGVGFVGTGAVRAICAQMAMPATPSPVPSAGIPADVQLLNADGNPTIRIPVSHSSLNWTLIKPRIRASFGWLEIDRGSVRYTVVRSSRITKEADHEFAFSRSDVIDVKMEYGAAEFRAGGLRHFFGYSPQNHWDAADSPNAATNSITRADGANTPFVLRALESFDGVVAELKARQQPAAPPPVMVQPEQPPAPKPVAAPAPATLVVIAPAGVSDNQTIEVNDSALTIRGVAVDDSGLPTISINGAPAALRPKGANVAEFWSDPISLKAGANHFEIVATTPARAISHIQFIAQFTPKTAPVNTRALDKDEIISLLKGGVPDSRVVELVKDRGIKFTPTPSDLEEIRAAGGSDDLVAAIKQTR